MFAALFRGCTQEPDHLPSTQHLRKTMDMLEEKENVLHKKILLETERAKEFSKAKNKQAALQCLKRKKYYEGQMEHIGSFQMRLHTEDERLTEMIAKNSGQDIKANVKGSFWKGSQQKRSSFNKR